MEQEDGKVRVMSPDERNAYDGVTIEDGENTQESPRQNYQRYYGSGDFRQGFTIRTLNWKDLLLGGENWLQRILMIAGVAAVLAFLFFVALPVMIVVLGVGVAVWLVLRLFFGK